MFHLNMSLSEHIAYKRTLYSEKKKEDGSYIVWNIGTLYIKRVWKPLPMRV